MTPTQVRAGFDRPSAFALAAASSALVITGPARMRCLRDTPRFERAANSDQRVRQRFHTA